MSPAQANALANWIRQHVPHWTVDACGVLVNGHGPELVCTNTRTGRQFLVKDERDVNATLDAEQKRDRSGHHKLRVGRDASSVATLAASDGLNAAERGEDIASVVQRLADAELKGWYGRAKRSGPLDKTGRALRDEMHRRGLPLESPSKAAARRQSAPKQRSLF